MIFGNPKPIAVDTKMFMAPYDMNSHARDKLLSTKTDTKPNTPDSDGLTDLSFGQRSTIESSNRRFVISQ